VRPCILTESGGLGDVALRAAARSRGGGPAMTVPARQRKAFGPEARSF
jgi:hypothetical protein